MLQPTQRQADQIIDLFDAPRRSGYQPIKSAILPEGSRTATWREGSSATNCAITTSTRCMTYTRPDKAGAVTREF
jgi:hypothetical protein